MFVDVGVSVLFTNVPWACRQTSRKLVSAILLFCKYTDFSMDVSEEGLKRLCDILSCLCTHFIEMCDVMVVCKLSGRGSGVINDPHCISGY